MKNWQEHQKTCRSVLRGYVRRFNWGAYGYELIDDAVAYGLCSAWDMDETGMTGEQVSKTITRFAAGFISREVRISRRQVSTVSSGPNGEDYDILDYFKASRATQEADCDAHKIQELVGDSDMLELMAYGDNKEGGIARVRAERKVREALGTYKALSARKGGPHERP